MRWWILLLILVALPAQARTYAHVQVTGDSRRVWPDKRPPILQAWHNMSLDNTATAGFPGDYWPYTLFYGARPSSPRADFDAFAHYLPGGIFLANMNATDLPGIYQFPNTYNNALKAIWDTTAYCLYDLTAHKVFTVHAYPNAYVYIVRKESADAMVAFQLNETFGVAWNVPWDGLFIDDCVPRLQHWFLQEIADSVATGRHSYDANGDTAPDDTTAIQAQYVQWRPYLTAQLRAALPGKILMGNSAGTLDDPALNGISIENVGGVGFDDSTEAIAAMISQKAVGTQPFYGVAIPVTQANVPSALAVVRSVPGVYYGVTSDNPRHPW